MLVKTRLRAPHKVLILNFPGASQLSVTAVVYPTEDKPISPLLHLPPLPDPLLDTHSIFLSPQKCEKSSRGPGPVQSRCLYLPRSLSLLLLFLLPKILFPWILTWLAPCHSTWNGASSGRLPGLLFPSLTLLVIPLGHPGVFESLNGRNSQARSKAERNTGRVCGSQFQRAPTLGRWVLLPYALSPPPQARLLQSVCGTSCPSL